jgi:hypothetical protein
MLVIIWAFVGIAVKHGDTPVVAIAAWVATGLVGLALAIGVGLLLRRTLLMEENHAQTNP